MVPIELTCSDGPLVVAIGLLVEGRPRFWHRAKVHFAVRVRGAFCCAARSIPLGTYDLPEHDRLLKHPRGDRLAVRAERQRLNAGMVKIILLESGSRSVPARSHVPESE